MLEPTSTSHSFKYLSSENVVSFQERKNSMSKSIFVSFLVSAYVFRNIDLWHVSLGHVPYSVIKKFNFMHCSSNFEYVCDICPKARQTRLSFKISQF